VGHNAYDEMRKEDQVMAVDRRPNDPEKTDPMYRMFVVPINVNWVQPQAKGGHRCLAPALVVEDEELLPTAGSEPRRVKSRIDQAT
jgi:hypothetical protein